MSYVIVPIIKFMIDREIFFEPTEEDEILKITAQNPDIKNAFQRHHDRYMNLFLNNGIRTSAEFFQVRIAIHRARLGIVKPLIVVPTNPSLN